jgi:hypothetical protein
MATLLKVLNNLADIKSAGGVALRVRTQGPKGEQTLGKISKADKAPAYNRVFGPGAEPSVSTLYLLQSDLLLSPGCSANARLDEAPSERGPSEAPAPENG